MFTLVLLFSSDSDSMLERLFLDDYTFSSLGLGFVLPLFEAYVNSQCLSVCLYILSLPVNLPYCK